MTMRRGPEAADNGWSRRLVVPGLVIWLGLLVLVFGVIVFLVLSNDDGGDGTGSLVDSEGSAGDVAAASSSIRVAGSSTTTTTTTAHVVPTPVEPARTARPDTLIAQWEQDNALCLEAQSYAEPDASLVEGCDRRIAAEDDLRAMGWCYGPEEAERDERSWQQCGPEGPDCDRIPSDMGLDPSYIIQVCEDGWAYVDECSECGGDSQSIIKWDGTRWARYTAFPTAMCRDELVRAGAPASVLGTYWTC